MIVELPYQPVPGDILESDITIYVNVASRDVQILPWAAALISFPR